MILTFTGENVGTLCHIGGYMESDIKYALSILSLGYSKNTLKGITHKYTKGDPLMWGAVELKGLRVLLVELSNYINLVR